MTSTIEAVKQAHTILQSGGLLCEVTAASILREATAAEEAQRAEPIGTVKQRRGCPEGSCFVLWKSQPVPEMELFARPAPPLAGERAALIKRLLEVQGFVSSNEHVDAISDAADMLAADATKELK